MGKQIGCFEVFCTDVTRYWKISEESIPMDMKPKSDYKSNNLLRWDDGMKV